MSGMNVGLNKLLTECLRDYIIQPEASFTVVMKSLEGNLERVVYVREQTTTSKKEDGMEEG